MRLALLIGVAVASHYDENYIRGYVFDRPEGYMDNPNRNYDRPWKVVEKEVRDDYNEFKFTMGGWKYIEEKVADAKLRWTKRQKQIQKKINEKPYINYED
jgi:hypothetical protein